MRAGDHVTPVGPGDEVPSTFQSATGIRSTFAGMAAANAFAASASEARSE